MGKCFGVFTQTLDFIIFSVADQTHRKPLLSTEAQFGDADAMSPDDVAAKQPSHPE
jgi:hypothetical protein